MKRVKRIFLWITGSVILLLAVIIALVFWSVRPTNGPQIEMYSEPRSALLIIDIQEDYTGLQAKNPYRDGDRIVNASNVLLAQAQSRGILVVYVKNVIDNPIISFLTGELNAPDSPGTEMDRRLIRVPGSITFIKNRPDAFSTPELDVYLRGNHVDQLFLAGLDGAYCVDATARGALNRGYKVTLFRDGIATESGKSIEKLAQSWRESGAHVKSGSKM